MTQAKLWKRIIACLLDYGIFFLLFSLYLSYFGTHKDGTYTVNGIKTLVIPLVWICYFVIVEGKSGATFAHHLFDLKVQRLDKKSLDYVDAFKRHLLDPIDIFIWGIPAIIAITSSENGQRLGDMFAGTIVIQDAAIKSNSGKPS